MIPPKTSAIFADLIYSQPYLEKVMHEVALIEDALILEKRLNAKEVAAMEKVLKILREQVRGYKAAFAVIEAEMNKAKKETPKRKVNRALKTYIAGEFEALLFAYCLGAWGEFPRSNEEEIKKALGKPLLRARKRPTNTS